MVTTAEILDSLDDPVEKAQFQMFHNMVLQMPSDAIRMMISVFVNELTDRGESAAGEIDDSGA